MWRFRGTPHYLKDQARRLGITPILADRARNNPEIYRCAVLLAQLCERYHKVRKENGKPVFDFQEHNQIKGTLGQVELELQKLHMLASTADAMLAEAYSALSVEPPQRPFVVLSDFDAPRTFPLGDGTVGAPDEAFDRAISESG